MAILSISSEFGTGALEIGHKLKAVLGYDMITLGALLDQAKQMSREMNLFNMKQREDGTDVLGGSEYISFMALVQAAILEFASKDNVIIMTRACNYLIKDIPHALGIRIVAPADFRIDRIMNKEGVSRETARLLVKQADREIDCSIYMIYGVGWDDPSSYELKFDTSLQSLNEIEGILNNLLRVKDTRKTPEAVECLRVRSMAARIKAKLVAHTGLYGSTLEMEVKGTGILLRGITRGKEEQKQIEKEAQEIAGAVPLICELKCQNLVAKKRNS